MDQDQKQLFAIDLKQGVIPISKAASSLALLIKRSRDNQQPIVVTQKGYPAGVILDVELFTLLCAEVEQSRRQKSAD